MLSSLNQFTNAVISLCTPLFDGSDDDELELRAMPVGEMPLVGKRPDSDSPMSVIPSDEDDFARLLHAASAVLFDVYRKLIKRGVWRAKFAPVHQSLLQPACVDGWGVFLGSVELARLWGLEKATYNKVTNRLDKSTRLRLAVCLNVSFKFAIGADRPARHVHIYVDADGNWHSLELAYLASVFLTPEEKVMQHEWALHMQEAQLQLEKILITTMALGSCLMCNPCCIAEQRLETLCNTASTTAHARVLAVLAFWVRVALLPKHGLYVTYGGNAEQLGNALLLCSMLAVDLNFDTFQLINSQFPYDQRLLASLLIDAAHEAATTFGNPDFDLWDFGFADGGWPAARFVSKLSIRRLYRATHVP